MRFDDGSLVVSLPFLSLQFLPIADSLRIFSALEDTSSGQSDLTSISAILVPL